ncbi:MAG: hypothetical protein ABIQ66_10030 [Novosphingobium sp.]
MVRPHAQEPGVMATVNPSSLPTGPQPSVRQTRRRRWPWIMLAAIIGAVVWYGGAIMGYARTGASLGAQVACSCRYVAGRPLPDCRQDFERGMALVVLTEDKDAHSVTARFPLLAKQTATFREGWGCVLEPWGS